MIDNEILTKIKEVSLPVILASFGIYPVRGKDPYSTANSFQYLATYRGEKNPSLSVFLYGRQWLYKDLATGAYGTNLDLLVEFGFFSDWRASAQYIADHFLHGSIIEKPFSPTVYTPKSFMDKSEYPGTILSESPIIGSPAEKYLSVRRRIPIHIADKYLSYVIYTYDYIRTFSGVSWPTMKGGHAIRWTVDLPDGKGKAFVGPGGISFFSAHKGERTDACSVFEGMMDYLSYLANREMIADSTASLDTIILNSMQNADKAMNVLSLYSFINFYKDNDDAGMGAFKVIEALRPDVRDMSYLYSGYKDYNDYWRNSNMFNR